MHEVLILKINKIYPSGMAHWQFLFFLNVSFSLVINEFIRVKNCVKVLMRMLHDVVFMRTMVITSNYISKVKFHPGLIS